MRSLAALEALYGMPVAAATVKVADHVTAHYRAFIDGSPFVALSTVGADGADCSPRGDAAGFVRVAGPRTLLMPDRRGNNRCDSLRNIVMDGRVGLLFLVPGSGTTLRVNGTAVLSVDPALCQSFAVAGAVAAVGDGGDGGGGLLSSARGRSSGRSCGTRPGMSTRRACPRPAPSWLALSEEQVGGAEYDRTWPERAAATMW